MASLRETDVMAKIRKMLATETVLVVAVVLAAASCVAVPPDALYADYVDWRTIGLLFCLMTVVSGVRELGILRIAGGWLLARARSKRAVAASFVALSFVSSMVVTNDVALIAFVPFALIALRMADMEDELCPVAVLMTVAANLGSMLTPIGNPQNLYLFSVSGFSLGEFLAATSPYAAVSAALLAVAVAMRFRKEKGGSGVDSTVGRRRVSDDASASADVLAPGGEGAPSVRSLVAYGVLFALCVVAVLGAFDVRALVVAVAIGATALDRRALLRVDYGLLLTFAALFVFVGNMGRIPELHSFVVGVVGADAALAAVCASQVLSNVPAAVLLSGFTDQWSALIVGANIGGLGTLIASMASLITFKAVSIGRPSARWRFLKTFTAWNAAFLAALLALYCFVG